MDDRTILGRALAIMDAVLERDDPISLAELTKAVGLPKATARRISNSMVSRGLLVMTPRGYTSGPRLAEAGARATEQHAIQLTATPLLQELYAETRAVVFLMDTRSATHWTAVGSIFDRSAAAFSFDWPRAPHEPAVLATAIGRVALAGRPDHVEELIRRGVPRLTPGTAFHRDEVRGLVAQAAEEGVAVEKEGVRLGWSCMAVAVGPAPHPDLVLGIVDRTPRFNAERWAALARRTAAAIDGARVRPY